MTRIKFNRSLDGTMKCSHCNGPLTEDHERIYCLLCGREIELKKEWVRKGLPPPVLPIRHHIVTNRNSNLYRKGEE